MAIDTGKVLGRRTVRFESLQEVVQDAVRLAAGEVRILGNWSFGQILDHLAKAMVMTIDGFEFKAPLLIRIVARLFMKRRFLAGKMPAGFQFRKGMQDLVPDEISVADGLERLRRAVERLETETHRAPSPIFGKITVEESNQLQLRHAELHLSFVITA